MDSSSAVKASVRNREKKRSEAARGVKRKPFVQEGLVHHVASISEGGTELVKDMQNDS